jgi:signal transduction histidine kinase
MHNEIRRLIDALREEAIMREGLAEELSGLADQYDRNGNHPRADGMRSLSRHHRIRSMQAYAQIAAITSKYSHFFRGRSYL